MPKTYEIAQDIRFDAQSGVLSVDGNDHILRPQSAEVLAYLAEHSGEVVGKAEIMDAVWPDTAVTDDSLVQCVGDIRRALGPDHGRHIVTVPRKGYRLDVDEVTPEASSQAPVSRRGVVAIVAALAVAVVALGFYVLQPPERESEAPPTLAVLPFRTTEAGEEINYFSAGVAEDLIVSLSRLSDLRVLSSGTTFSQDRIRRDPREVAADLKATHVLEGTAARRGEALRLSAALVDGTSGEVIWAKAYEGEGEDIFAFQEEVLNALVRVLSVRLSRAERERLEVRGTDNVEAHDAFLKGRAAYATFREYGNREAIAALERAVSLDPDFALAHAHLSIARSFNVEYRWSDDPATDVKKAFAAARRSLELDPELPFGHFVLGRLYTRAHTHRPDQAEQHFRRAIDIDPNYVDAYVFLANVYNFDGKPELALPLVEEGMARNPTPPFWYHLAEGMTHFFLGDFEKAIPPLTRARDQSPTSPHAYRFLISAYGHVGDIDEAEWMAIEYAALGRDASVSGIIDTASVNDPTAREIYAEGLRKAGLPE